MPYLSRFNGLLGDSYLGIFIYLFVYLFIYLFIYLFCEQGDQCHIVGTMFSDYGQAGKIPKISHTQNTILVKQVLLINLINLFLLIISSPKLILNRW